MRALLKLSESMRRLLEWIALTSGWLLVIMAVVTSFDVVARKFGMQLPYTKLQELEWHFHAAIFSLWMGYCYTINAHPRVDTFTERMTYRGKAWVELVGCLVLALPYMALVAYYSISFVEQSYLLGEQSDSTVGLTHRWIIKGVYAAGLWLVVLGILSVLLRVIVFLFGRIAALNKRLTIKMLNEAIYSSCRANGLVFLIFLGATGFSYVFRVLGGDELMMSTLTYIGIDTKWEMLTFVMVLIFLLGFPFEWIEICLIILPVFGPILAKYDFSDHIGNNTALMTWFGTLVAVNLQTAFMTPPFGATLFYMKGTAPPGVTMTDVFRAMYPFVVLQVIGLLLCIYFPGISLWLPRLAGFLE